MSHVGLLKYRVYFQPILQADDNEYGSEIEVSDRILISGLGEIRESIDASDYDIGVYVGGDLELAGKNYNGYFNENDTRSIFPAIRDRCKVRIVFHKSTMVRSSTGTVTSETEEEVITYRGLINEEATRLDIVTERIRFKVLSRDSVLRTTKISSGVVGNGDLCSEAILQILNVPRITSILTVSALNIDPDLDFEIDDGTWFDNKSVKEALDKLLLSSNSCLLIDDDGVIYVRSREEDMSEDPLNLYGQYDLHKRENIIDITAYNQGKHRFLTSIRINDTIRSNEDFVQAFGLRSKTIDLPFITDADTEREIADRLVDEFKTPKIEMSVKVSTDLAKNLNLLDRVSVNYPLRVEPIAGTFLPVIGITAIGDAVMPLPNLFGAISIEPRIGFKIIEITHNPERFTSVLKLRQFGKDFDDGVFDPPGSCIVGFSIIGDAVICAGGSECDTFENAPVGAGVVGCSVIQ